MPRKKVKDMPRKQQMAVKAAMAEKAAGKKSPAKSKIKKVVKKVKSEAIKKVKSVKREIDAAKKLFIPSIRKRHEAEMIEKGRKARKKMLKESLAEGAQGLVSGGAAGVKRGLKDSLKGQKVKKRMLQKTLKRKTTEYDYENDDRGMDTNPIKPKSSALKMKTSPALAKLSASCKAAARRKFKVYPSAYANMWASRTQKKGKC